MLDTISWMSRVWVNWKVWFLEFEEIERWIWISRSIDWLFSFVLIGVCVAMEMILVVLCLLLEEQNRTEALQMTLFCCLQGVGCHSSINGVLLLIICFFVAWLASFDGPHTISNQPALSVKIHLSSSMSIVHLMAGRVFRPYSLILYY